MNTFTHRLTIFLLTFGLIMFSVISIAGEAKRTITQVKGDLYRFDNNFHASVFLVTPDGIIVTDPINASAASWLKEKLKARFNKPIKYVIYSHDHRDHIAGGEVFADEAIIVAHELTKEKIIGEKRPTAIPDVTFKDRMTIELGGKRVDLIYPGRSHSDNLIVIHFPEERAVFTVDFISVNRVAFKNLPDAHFPDWLDAIKVVESLDFDILIPGHGPNGTKKDATEHRNYLTDLYHQVIDASRAGYTSDATAKIIDLSKYSRMGMYKNWMPMNIEGMHNIVNMHRRGN